MKMTWFGFAVRAFFLLLISEHNLYHCMHVTFYGSERYKGPAFTIEVTAEQEQQCIQLNSAIKVASIKTEKCVILYSDNFCNRSTLTFASSLKNPGSVRVDRDTPNVKYPMNYWLHPRDVRSFHVCSQRLGGGHKLDLDIYENELYLGPIVASYRNLCSCRNLPDTVIGGKTRKISIDNHGNGMVLFERKDCQGVSRTLEAGDNYHSRIIFLNTIPTTALFDVKSISMTNKSTCEI